MIRLPPHPRGLKIGLFGGTFDPPHAAHRAACLLAMQRLGLDRVWWLVTPGNPLKDTRGFAPSPSASQRRRRSPNTRASSSPASRPRCARATPTTRCARSIARCPGVHFVWIMGADNLRSFHRWQKWRAIADLFRSPWSIASARASTPPPAAAQALSRFRIRSGPRGRLAAPQAARLGVPARAEVAAVLHGAARAARPHVNDSGPEREVRPCGGAISSRRWLSRRRSGRSPRRRKPIRRGHHHHRAVRGGRRVRRRWPHHRGADGGAARPADDRREHHRRRRHHRREPRRWPPSPTAKRCCSGRWARTPTTRRSTRSGATTRSATSRRSRCSPSSRWCSKRARTLPPAPSPNRRAPEDERREDAIRLRRRRLDDAPCLRAAQRQGRRQRHARSLSRRRRRRRTI